MACRISVAVDIEGMDEGEINDVFNEARDRIVDWAVCGWDLERKLYDAGGFLVGIVATEDELKRLQSERI